MPLAILFDATLLAVCCYAVLHGGRPERWGAAINLLATSATLLLRLRSAAHLAPMDLATVLVDLAVASSFYSLAITTTRFWPIWAGGFAVADLFMSALGGLLPRVPLFAYHTGLGIYAYLALGALALGTFRLPRDAEPYLRNGSRTSWLRHLKETN